MNHISTYTFLVFWLSSFLCSVGVASEKDTVKTTIEDPLCDASTVRNWIRYKRQYDFIRYEKNFIQWADFSVIQPFFDKIQQTPNRKLRILHIGDSHVQADIYTNVVRNTLQERFGFGGRGVIFPFAAAQTHSVYDYHTTKVGKWSYSKNIQINPAHTLGVSGMTIRTIDVNAGFTFSFRESALRDSFTVVKVLCDRKDGSFDLKLKYDEAAEPLFVPVTTSDSSFVEIRLPYASRKLEFEIVKSSSEQRYFECYGIILESSNTRGVLYNSVGVNGAGLRSFLKQDLYGKQAQDLNPDLVILDLGGNEFYAASYFKENEVENLLKESIDKIRLYSPQASILVLNTQDSYYRKRNVVGCKEFATLSKRIAFEKNCAYYDYYDVSGGHKSMLAWFENGLAQYDKIHLTHEGYAFKGELFVNALYNSYQTTLLQPSIDSFVMNTTLTNDLMVSRFVDKKEDTELLASTKDIDKTLETTSTTRKTYKTITKVEKIQYKIRKGDNLGYIAQRYHVSIKDLMRWNNLSSHKIYQGKAIVIHKKVKVNVPVEEPKKIETKKEEVKTVLASKEPEKTEEVKTETVVEVPKEEKTTISKEETSKTSKTTHTKALRKHTVKQGESLWIIARKYKVEVTAIKKANKLKSEMLHKGMELTIPAK